jgi:hypothetical protein
MECTPLSLNSAPVHLTLATLHRKLNTMAMGDTSNRGGGNHGYLALVMTESDYPLLTNMAFDIPVHPGHTLNQVPPNRILQRTIAYMLPQ